MESPAKRDEVVPGSFFFFFFLINLFIYFWLHWVFIAAHGLSLVAVSGAYSLLRCAGFSLRWLLLLRSMGFRCVGFSSCGTWGLVALRHVGSSRTRAGAHVACIGRWFLKHCTTREATRCQVLLASFKPLDSPKPDFGLLPYKSQRKVLLVLHPI